MLYTDYLEIDISIKFRYSNRRQNSCDFTAIKIEPVKKTLQSLFCELIEENKGHCRNLDLALKVDRISGEIWKPKFRSYKVMVVRIPKSGDADEALYYFNLQSLNPATLGPVGYLNYTLPILVRRRSLDGNLENNYNIYFTGQIKISYKMSLQSLSMGVILQNVKTLEKMIEIVKINRRLTRVKQLYLLPILSEFYFDTSNPLQWKLLIVAGGRDMLPNVTNGELSSHKIQKTTVPPEFYYK